MPSHQDACDKKTASREDLRIDRQNTPAGPSTTPHGQPFEGSCGASYPSFLWQHPYLTHV